MRNRKTVQVDASEFIRTHHQRPRSDMFGNWTIHVGDPMLYLQMYYHEAKKQAIEKARREGLRVIQVIRYD